MKGAEVLRTLKEQRTDQHRFVKWWRKENDFLDYDMIDRFLDHAGGNEEIGGIELLTMDDLWNEVHRIAGKRVKRVQETTGELIEWVHQGRKNVCLYSPETLMEIFDAETKGNPVDS